MFNKTQMIAALNALASPATLQTAIAGLQMYHAPNHLEVTHVRPPNQGYGSSFFMKRKMVTTVEMRPNVWTKVPAPTNVTSPDMSFGALEPTTRADEARIIGHLKTCDSGAVAADRDDFVFFTDVPEPYVGFDFPAGASLPVEAGYLCFVIGRAGPNLKLRSVYSCTQTRYLSKAASVIRRAGNGIWSA
ncbi:hypothetical protein RNZ50_20025 [Paracoccaceae bacterium Fryx2]|nr:hypothetical protein [Paracoccaceae bacterium Fryx2]